MFCSECGQKLPKSAKFCPECGTTVELETGNPGATPSPTSKLQTQTVKTAPAANPVTDNWLKKNWVFVAMSLGVAILFIAGVINYLQKSGLNIPASNQPGLNNTAAFSQPGTTSNIPANQTATQNEVINQPGSNADADFRQWWNNAGAFYQEYTRLCQEYETVAQNQGTTPRESTNAYARMVQGFQAMYGRLGQLQPPSSVMREDATDMAQTQKIWSDLLTAEVQVGQEYLQYAQRGQNPPAQFLNGTMPQLMQARNNASQQLQQAISRMTARHPANFNKAQ